MAGLVAALFGGKSRPANPDPLPGLGGYSLGPGPYGEDGFPGSTSQTRTFKTNNPRTVGLRADTNSGWESGLGTETILRKPAHKFGDHYSDAPVRTPKGRIRQNMQDNAPGQFYGGPMLHTGPYNNTAGGNPLSASALAGGHSEQDTQTPWYLNASLTISGGVPGANNVRNQVAQRYKNPAGQMHTYMSAPRADQAPVNMGGQATDGNVKLNTVSSPVTVLNRSLLPSNGGNWSWSVLREMPYGGRGNGARGADLNGNRYYATGQQDQFWNAGMGDYGIARSRGLDYKSPVGFTEPAPWTANYYTTTDSIGTTDNPNLYPGQMPSMVIVSPSTGRASNSTGRTG